MNKLLSTESITKKFGGVYAANNISVDIDEYSVVGLIGSNGAGKTTFLNIITGYLKPDSGNVIFNQKTISNLSPREISHEGITRSFQIPQLFSNLSVEKNLEIGVRIIQDLTPIKLIKEINHSDKINELLEQFALTEFAKSTAGNLSEGTRKLLDISLALVSKPKLLLLDEPTSGVSADEKFILMDKVMSAVKKFETTVLFVEHDMEIIEKYTNRILAFYDGKIISDGTPDEVLKNQDVKKFVTGE
jgi:branched-chain amino acid transport system ATP-binding protein